MSDRPLAPVRTFVARPSLVLPSAVAWGAQALLAALALPLAAAALRREGTNPLEAAAGAVTGMGALAVATVALLALVDVLDRERRAPPELSRKVAHVGAGLVACAAPYAFSSHWPMLLLVAGFTALLLASGRVGVLAPLHPKERPGRGDLVYPAGLYLAFLLADGNALTYQVAVLTLAVADPAAAIAGRTARAARFTVAGAERSLRGSAAFAATAFLIAAPLLAAAGRMAPTDALAAAVAVALTTAAVEAVSPPGLDNAAIPVATVLALSAWI